MSFTLPLAPDAPDQPERAHVAVVEAPLDR
jgi:hypothetical protein